MLDGSPAAGKACNYLEAMYKVLKVDASECASGETLEMQELRTKYCSFAFPTATLDSCPQQLVREPIYASFDELSILIPHLFFGSV